MIRGNNSDFIRHPLPEDSISAHGASHQAWAPGLPTSKSGTVACSIGRHVMTGRNPVIQFAVFLMSYIFVETAHNFLIS